ncbi:MAG: pseudouridine synthase [Candidatus Nanoarchaeia archaeon]|nr:pseudouridine synthase [Candidatus Nanoarchaeia archaeon]
MEERVQKIIAESGLCSRRKAEALIEQGRVFVNDKQISLGDKADGEKDIIKVNNKQIKKEKKVYYMLNKPKNYITTSDDLYERKKVTDLVPDQPRVFAVGRLDRDSTGILLLTNDGEFANKVMHPRYEIKKTYVATLKTKFNKEDLKKFKDGIYIEGQSIKSDAKIINDNTLEITLHVGLHKIVKRLLKEIGYYVDSLQRTKINNLELDVPLGTYRPLTKADMDLIFKKI